MLTIYRRHRKNCKQRMEGRDYRRCLCPIWVDGSLNGVEIRKSLGFATGSGRRIFYVSGRRRESGRKSPSH